MQRMDANDVARYLKENPRFFEDYADQIADIFVPHPHGGHAIPIAERLRKSAGTATPESLGERNLTASFGVTEAALGEPASQVLSRADTALYRAKSLGRDRVEVEICR